MDAEELRKWVEEKTDWASDGLRAGVGAIRTGIDNVFDPIGERLTIDEERNARISEANEKQRLADAAYSTEFTDKAVADFHERLSHIRHPFEPAMPPAVNGLRGAVNGSKVSPTGLEPVRIPSAMAVRG